MPGHPHNIIHKEGPQISMVIRAVHAAKPKLIKKAPKPTVKIPNSYKTELK